MTVSNEWLYAGQVGAVIEEIWDLIWNGHEDDIRTYVRFIDKTYGFEASTTTMPLRAFRIYRGISAEAQLRLTGMIN